MPVLFTALVNIILLLILGLFHHVRKSSLLSGSRDGLLLTEDSYKHVNFPFHEPGNITTKVWQLTSLSPSCGNEASTCDVPTSVAIFQPSHSCLSAEKVFTCLILVIGFCLMWKLYTAIQSSRNQCERPRCKGKKVYQLVFPPNHADRLKLRYRIRRASEKYDLKNKRYQKIVLRQEPLLL